MPRGVPKAAAATRAPPPTRVVSSRSAKARANASILEHDTDIDALIRKHDKKGARGFAKLRKTTTTAQDEAMEAPSEQTKENRDDFVDAPATSKATKPKRTAKAKSSKKLVSSDEPAKIPDASTPPPSSPKKTVLGESNRVAVHSDRVSSDKREGPSSPQRLQSPVRRRLMSPKKRKHMPEIQVASFLENYDLEAENRLRIARKTLQITIDSARTQMHAKAIARLPRSVRLMRLGDFIHEFNADVQAAVERNAVVANRAREEAWEDEKLQRKRKEADLHPAGDDAEDEAVEGKVKLARVEKKEERKGIVSPPPSKRTTKSKKPVRKAAKGTRSALLSSPPLASTPPPRSPSKVKPPSSTSFTPHLAPGVKSAMPSQARTPATGKARTARPSEQVQWLSLNGSPIIGIVAPDGTVHAMPRTLRTAATPVHAKTKSARNWDVIEDENGSDPEQDAETSATQLLELAKGLDERTRHKSVKATASANPSPSRSRRETLDGYDSDEGGSVFEEARSRPGDSQEPSLLHDGDDSSLPDEEAYMAQVMREEEQKRSRMLASEPRIARSSTSIKFGSRSSGESSTGAAAGAARASHSTIRAVPSGGKSSHKLSSSSNGPGRLPSSPMVRNKASASRLASSSSSASTSSSPSKGRVSIVFASGSSHRMTNLSVESLMRLPSHERDQMIDILEKLKQAQSLAAS